MLDIFRRRGLVLDHLADDVTTPGVPSQFRARVGRLNSRDNSLPLALTRAVALGLIGPRDGERSFVGDASTRLLDHRKKVDIADAINGLGQRGGRRHGTSLRTA